jgi:hypothetical protein
MPPDVMLSLRGKSLPAGVRNIVPLHINTSCNNHVKQNLPPNWGGRGLTRFHPDLCVGLYAHLLGPVTGSTVRPTGRAGLKPAPSKPFGVTLTGGIRWILSGGDSQSVVSTPWRLFTSYSSRSTRYEDWRNYTTLSAPGKGSHQVYRRSEVVMQMNDEIFGWSPFSNLDSHVKLFAQ